MSRPALTRALASAAVLLVWTAGSALAQVSDVSSAQSSDPFAAYHSMLSSAADEVLASGKMPPDLGPSLDPSTASRSAPQPVPARKPPATNRALARVEDLRPIIDPILRAEGVPTALAAVVLIESGGQPTALSPKGARGIWQFMPDTARRYGLVVDGDRDERTDVVKSTRAAARYLKDLYGIFDSWPLALAAYNAGEEFVQAALGRAGGTGFEAISSRLPLETRNYVPAVLRAMRQFGEAIYASQPARESSHVLYADGDFE